MFWGFVAAQPFLRPSGLRRFPFAPRACALGCIIAPLRGLRTYIVFNFFLGSEFWHRLGEPVSLQRVLLSASCLCCPYGTRRSFGLTQDVRAGLTDSAPMALCSRMQSIVRPLKPDFGWSGVFGLAYGAQLPRQASPSGSLNPLSGVVFGYVLKLGRGC